ncbi:MAG TPA: DUF1566 domain-containing protein [Xanthomonadales bacterium]|nr:DUF1566 domain-containing protein [Xanthomonadales bacterium]
MIARNMLYQMVATLVLAAVGSLASAQSDAPPAADPPPPARFEAFTDGTVLDHQTGLYWANKDNGGDIDWAGAKSHCQLLGSGWELPTADELVGIYLPDGSTDAASAQDCIGKLTCKLTPLISVTGLTPWAQEANGPAEAWYVYLSDGQKYSYDANDTEGRRALCVRR